MNYGVSGKEQRWEYWLQREQEQIDEGWCYYVCKPWYWWTRESNEGKQWERVRRRIKNIKNRLYGSRRFSTMFTGARHQFLSLDTWIQSTYSRLFLWSILMLSSHIRQISWLPEGFPTCSECALLCFVVFLCIAVGYEVGSMQQVEDRTSICFASDYLPVHIFIV